MSLIRGLYKRGYEALNYRLSTFAGGNFASYCRPTTITFLLTDKCNARCVHCDIWKNTGPEDNPSLDQLKTCLRDLRGWLGPVHVCFSGGEALLKPYTIELVEYARDLGLFAELLTNGFCADQSRIQRLAMVNPWRITVSLDGLGEVHDLIRGREGFFAMAATTMRTLAEMRRKHGLKFRILLKTVVMEHNLEDLSAIARYAAENDLEVRYQPIEQNYNTEERSLWFTDSPNWPRDTERAKAAVRQLIEMKRQRFPIVNSYAEFRTMLDYFERPSEFRIAVQSHLPPDQPALCAAVSDMQIQANGDVKICARRPPVGKIQNMPIRNIWQNRPQFWLTGCCRNDARQAQRRGTDVLASK